MSTSFIYHMFGLRGYEYVWQDLVAGNIILTVRPKDGLIRCPCCQSRNFIRPSPRNGVRLCPWGSSPSGWHSRSAGRGCRNCGAIRLIDIQFVEPRRWDTRAFERYDLALARRMTI
jgi:hypothetical protein